MNQDTKTISQLHYTTLIQGKQAKNENAGLFFLDMGWNNDAIEKKRQREDMRLGSWMKTHALGVWPGLIS